MLKKIQDTIQKYALFAPMDKILVAVSGGADSIMLAYCLQKLGYEMGIVHCNFQLRGAESDSEEAFVKSFSEKNNIPFFVKKFETQAIVEETNASIQVVARNLRYAFFEEILNTQDYHVCALAHHADDQAETLFMSLLKGNSPQIWKAMPIKRGKYVRPLLYIRKSEILEATKQFNIPFCTDSSNLKNNYSRNYTRNVVFPTLFALNANFIGHLISKNDLYTQQITFIDNILERYITAENEIVFEPFVKDFGTAFLEMFILYFCQKKGIFGYLTQDICALKDSISGKYVKLPNGKMIKTRTGLAFIPAEIAQISAKSYPLFTGKTSINWGGQTLMFTFPYTEEIDFEAMKNSKGKLFYLAIDKISFPLQIRTWQQGDKMMPLGMRNYKKISDIMIDNKFSALQKQNTFVIEDAKGEILALSGFRISEKAKMGEQKDNILEIRIEA